MAFKFEVSRARSLPSADVFLLEGTVLDGRVTTGSEVVLTRGSARVRLLVHGVKLGPGAPRGRATLSLTCAAQPGHELADAGDELAGAIVEDATPEPPQASRSALRN